MSKREVRNHEKVNVSTESKKTEPYRFGIGIELIDSNVINGPEIESVVNGEITDEENEFLGNKKLFNDDL
jgi:hypothetical protein